VLDHRVVMAVLAAAPAPCPAWLIWVLGIAALSFAAAAAGLWAALRGARRAHLAAQVVNARHRELADNLGVCVWMLDAQSLEPLYLNAGLAHILARAPGTVCGPGLATDAVHADDRERVADAYRDALGAGTLCVEYRVHDSAGRLRWVRDRACVVRTHQGVAARLAGITDDVTDRRTAVDALRESQRAMTTLFSNLPGMVYRCRNDPQWTMEFVSEGCSDLTGYRPADLIDNARVAYADIIHSADRDAVWKKVQQGINRRGPFEITYRIVTATGDVRWVWEMGRGVFDEAGGLLALEGFIADHTARRSAELALQESEQRYRSLVENAPIAILIHREEQFVFVNPAAARMLGAASPQELVGRSIWDIVHPDFVDVVRPRVEAIYNQQQAPAVEERFRRLDGEVIDVEVTGSPVEFEGRPASQAVFTDITHRKRAEAERVRLEAQLRQSQKMQAVGQLAGGVAHDFNNILTAILGHLGLARDAFAKSLPEEHPGLRGLGEVERAANRAVALTRQLLTFSRKDVARPQVLDVNAIVRDMRSMLRRLITENIDLELTLAPDLPAVRADANQLEQVVLNLVVNARDAMPHGGRLAIATRRITLDAAYAAGQPDATPGPYVQLSVSDSGHGIDAATIERIFEPFFTTKDVGQGSGLGLATVHGIVQQNGGHVTVYSEPGLGATFRVFLPAAEGSAGAEAPAPQAAEALEISHDGETVLVCEDDPSVRHLTTQMLRSAGYHVLAAATGAAALKVARQHTGRLHLLVTDVIMPEMNGRQVAKALAAERPDLRVLYISGYTSDVIAHQGVVEDGIDFLEKPFSQADLLRRVREVLDRSQSAPSDDGA